MADRKMKVDYEIFDAAIFCALYEEAETVKNVFESFGWTVQKKNDSLIDRDYVRCTVQNKADEHLAVYVTWLPKFGPVNMAIHAERVLSHHVNFRLLLMTGICAGDKAKVHLGDLVIASGAYAFDSGKAKIVDGHYELEPDPDLKSIPDHVLQPLRAFDSWKALVSKEVRPLSKHQQRDALIRKLLESKKFREISTGWLHENAPAWQTILKELKAAKDPIIDTNNSLIARNELKVRVREDYSFEDPPDCQMHICEVASTAAVREDTPFKNLHNPVRKTFAIDMEGHSFYKVAQDHNKPALFVKGVCDYADPDKDDSYHKYAARVSALFALSYLRERLKKGHPGEPLSPFPSANAPSWPSSAAHSGCATSDILFWHTVNDRIAERKDVGSLVAESHDHVLISGICLSYVIRQCKAQLLGVLNRKALVGIILPDNTPRSFDYYSRYTHYVSAELPTAHRMYRTFFSELNTAQKQSFVFICTSIPLTHSIGLYDNHFYVNEFCIDHSSSRCPSFSPRHGSPAQRVLAAELKILINEGTVICGSARNRLRNISVLKDDD